MTTSILAARSGGTGRWRALNRETNTRTFGRRAALWSPRRRPAGAVQQVVSMESRPDTAGLVAVQPVLPIAPYVGGKRALAARLVAQIAPAST